MKKNASVLILAVRSCFYKCIVVMALTVAAEFILFAVSALRQGIPSLEKVFTGSGIPLIAGIGALVILFLFDLSVVSVEKKPSDFIDLAAGHLKQSRRHYYHGI